MTSSGTVNLQDFNILASRFGNALGPGAAAAAMDPTLLSVEQSTGAGADLPKDERSVH